MQPPPTIPSRVMTQIARRPDHVAIRDSTHSLSYAQLGHAVAAGVARLTALGATSGAIDTHSGTHVDANITTAQPPVVVIAPLGCEGLVLQLAVMFSGRVCSPLETKLPIDTLVSTIRFIGGPVICLDPEVQRALTDAGVAHIDATDLRLDALLHAPARQLVDPGGVPDAPGGAALLCFTSGSTGTPKGVVIPHSKLMEQTAFAGTGEDDVVAITSPPSFFASMLQTLMAIITGGTGVYLDLSSNTPAQLHDIAVGVGLNHFTGTTTHVRELARASVDEPIDTIWGINLGGEPTTRADLELFRQAFPNARIRNLYGSAELGRLTTVEYGPTDPLPPPGPIPAGRPAPGKTLAMLDEQGRPVPAGEPGRIAISPPEVFLGYWRDPELTATKFLTTEDGTIWSIIGDLGRIDDDGTLIVVGRSDDQVKIRGRFVNPREVDSLLLADPRIRAAITIAVPPEAPVQLRTIAVSDDPNVTQPELRHMLAQSLPLYALPRQIVFVDEIPVTTRGKPDMAALAGLSDLATGLPVSATNTGRTTGEEAILGVIREHLEVDVSITDDIFAMGADSLLAVELIETIAELFGVRISPAQLVANPTAAELAELLHNGTDNDTMPGLTTLFDSDHPTAAHWVLGADENFGPARLAQLTAPIRSFCTRVVGATPPERLLPSITAIGEANADRIGAVASPNNVIIGYSAGTLLALETACALARRGATPDLLLLVDPPNKEQLARWREQHRIPSPLRHPRKFLGALRRRNDELRRPFADDDSFERTKRFVNRHTQLFLRHTMTPYDGRTVTILSQEYVEAGGTLVTDAGLARPASQVTIVGDHLELLVGAQPLATAILEILTDQGLLSRD